MLNDPLVTQPLLLIYQMQKAGSQTIEATLQQAGLPHHIFRFHFLSPARAAVIERQLERFPHPLWRENQRYQLDMAARLTPVLRARQTLGAWCHDLPKIQIITGVREPVGCLLSWIFQNHFVFFESPEATTLDACRDAMLHAEPLQFFQNWFDTELKTMIGLDVFATPFPREEGCAVFENALARVLVYRFEALARLPALMQQFLGCDVPPLANKNIGQAKEYAAPYLRAKKQLRLPAALVAEHYDSKMVRHFYSDAERAQFVARWSEPASTKAAAA